MAIRQITTDSNDEYRHISLNSSHTPELGSGYRSECIEDRVRSEPPTHPPSDEVQEK